MTTLYLAWQHQPSRRWYPIGRLVRDQSANEEFEFTYVQGANEAAEHAGFKAIPEFPELGRTYRAYELFPTFRNRAMNTNRADRAIYLRQLGLDEADSDAMAELSASGGRSYADNLEIFPEIEPDEEGGFLTELTLHGLRHTNHAAIAAVERLKAGDELGVALELTNPVTKIGLLVHSRDYHTLGWLPRYFVEALHDCCDLRTLNLALSVARVHHQAPLSHRLRVKVRGLLEAGINPMRSVSRYQPIVTTNGSA